MKKLILSTATIALLVLAGCTSSSSTNNLQTSKSSQETKYIKVEDISFDDLIKKLDAKEDFAYIVSRVDCSHCQKLKAYLKTYEAENKVIYSLETTKLSQAQKNELIKRDPELSATPTTYFYKGNTLASKIVGFDEDTYKVALDGYYK